MSQNVSNILQATASAGPRNLDLPQSQASTQPAGFGVRFCAVFVDAIVLTLIKLPVSIMVVITLRLISGTGAKPAGMELIAERMIDMIAFIGIAYNYFGWFYLNKGGTPGKLLFGLRVVDSETGTHLTYGRTFRREILAKLVSGVIFCIGYLMVLFRKDRKALHDLMIGTQVLRQGK